MRIDHFRQGPEAAHRAFLRNKERRVNPAVGIVHGDDQIPPLIRNPLMTGPVLMQHHANHRAAGPLAAMSSTSGGGLDPAMALQRQT